MKEPSDLAKALDVILKNSAIEQTNGSRRNGYATPPIVAYGEENSPEGEVHLRDYWRTIRKRLWLIAGLALIVSSVAAIKQARLADIYQARARVQVDAETFSPALGASRGGSVYVDSYMDPEYFNTQVQILTSPTLLRRVAKTLDLEHNSNFLNPPASNRSTWQSVLRMFGFERSGKEAGPKSQVPIIAEGYSSSLGTDDATSNADEVERLEPYDDSLQP